MLIKSFEGFRPRAIQRAEGGWIIGYGHTLSAREGATVSEADAELLLRYDLLPVEKSVNDAIQSTLNQHQFDALVSFAFSVGVDDFAASDVRHRLNTGSPAAAADAMMGWPEPALPETALRRRAAERALFVANPAAPVVLSDLLAAPLPPPAVTTLPEPTPATPVELEAEAATTDEAQAAIETVAPVEAADMTEPVAVVDSRGAAVAALLGEPADRLVQPDAPTELSSADGTAQAEEGPDRASQPQTNSGSVIVPFSRTPAATETAPSEPVDRDQPVETATSEAPASDAPASEAPASDEVKAEVETTPADEATTEPEADPAPSSDVSAWAAARYSPYSSVMVGPLPYLQPATTPQATVVATDEPGVTLPVVEQVPTTQQEVPAAEAPAEVEAVETYAVETHTPEPAPGGWTSVAPVPTTELFLTPLDDTAELAISRPLWTPEQREEPDGSENNLFGEDLTLTLGGAPIMRHEIEMEAPARFDWKETGPFIFMGGVGLVSFGASMAAFRRAAEQSGGGDLTIIGWVLALIGLGCVGVSSINLYRKFGLPGGD